MRWSDTTFWSVMMVCIAAVLLALIAVGYKSCEQNQDMRAACVQGGRTPHECMELHP